MNKKLVEIDALTRPDHYYLSEDDVCAFYGEYAARQGFGFGPTNDLISNLKKSPLRRGRPEYRYKLQAVETASRLLRDGINSPFFSQCTVVPIPPSRVRTDPEYDDRMLQVAHQMIHGTPANVRELVVQLQSTHPAHTSDERPCPDDLVALYRIDEAQCVDIRQNLIVLDDVLTTGSHFVAMKRVLLARFPDRQILGLFIARRDPSLGAMPNFEML